MTSTHLHFGICLHQIHQQYLLLHMFEQLNLTAQTYVEGDIVGEFGADICQNGDGYWSYQEQGFGKVTFLALFATW